MTKQAVHITVGVIVAAVLLLVFAVTLLPQLHGRMVAPRVSSLTYTETRYQKWGWCMPFCTYSRAYNYRAEGKQTDIAFTMISDLAEQGYTLDRRRGDALCWGDAGDKYYFRRADESGVESESMLVVFYADHDLGDVRTSAVGCERPPTSYRVEITKSNDDIFGI